MILRTFLYNLNKLMMEIKIFIYKITPYFSISIIKIKIYKKISSKHKNKY